MKWNLYNNSFFMIISSLYFCVEIVPWLFMGAFFTLEKTAVKSSELPQVAAYFWQSSSRPYTVVIIISKSHMLSTYTILSVFNIPKIIDIVIFWIFDQNKIVISVFFETIWIKNVFCFQKTQHFSFLLHISPIQRKWY